MMWIAFFVGVFVGSGTSIFALALTEASKDE